MKLGKKGQKAVSIGKKAIAVGSGIATIAGIGLGVKKTHDDVKAGRKEIRETNRGTLMSSFRDNPQIKPMGSGTQVIGVSRGSGSVGHNIYGAGIQAGVGVQPTRSAPAPRTLPPPAPPLPPVNIKKEAARGVAGVVGGQISAGEAVRDVAGAAFQGMGGRRGGRQTNEALSRAGRDAAAGATVAVGAENINPTLRDVARVGKAKAKRKAQKLNPFSGRG